MKLRHMIGFLLKASYSAGSDVVITTHVMEQKSLDLHNSSRQHHGGADQNGTEYLYHQINLTPSHVFTILLNIQMNYPFCKSSALSIWVEKSKHFIFLW